MILVENIKKKISTEFVTYLKQQYDSIVSSEKRESDYSLVKRFSFFVGFKPEFNTENERKHCRGRSTKAEKEKK